MQGLLNYIDNTSAISYATDLNSLTKLILYLSYRRIVIPASAFDSKPKFLEKTRNAFGGGLFNISDANARDIEAYYNYLKEEYYAGTPKAFYAVELIGRQKETGSWCLSKEVQV